CGPSCLSTVRSPITVSASRPWRGTSRPNQSLQQRRPRSRFLKVHWLSARPPLLSLSFGGFSALITGDLSNLGERLANNPVEDLGKRYGPASIWARGDIWIGNA